MVNLCGLHASFEGTTRVAVHCSFGAGGGCGGELDQVTSLLVQRSFRSHSLAEFVYCREERRMIPLEFQVDRGLLDICHGSSRMRAGRRRFQNIIAALRPRVVLPEQLLNGITELSIS